MVGALDAPAGNRSVGPPRVWADAHRPHSPSNLPHLPHNRRGIKVTWFKVDDAFCTHPKVQGLDLAALGLWVKAGSWCAQQLTDGVISDREIRTLGGTRKQAEKLVTAGLWSVDDAPPSSRRYVFNDWRDYQPTRRRVLDKRAKDAARKAEARAAKQAKREFVRADSTADVRAESQAPSACLSALPDPTRPDLTKGVGVVGELQAARGGAESPPPDLDSAVDAAVARLAADVASNPPRPDAPTGPPRGALPDSWCSADDPRCWEHRELPRDQVPACGACGSVRAWFAGRDRQEAEKTRRDVQECSMCDERGLVEVFTPSGRPMTVRCDHKTPPELPKDAPGFRSSSSAEARRAARARLRGGAGSTVPPF